MEIINMKELQDILKDLSDEERKVLEYFIKNISIGEILAVKEIRLLYGIDKPEKVLDSLIIKGLIEKAPGCFNLSRRLREIIKRSSKKPTVLT
jgi:DNA-binding MarR family transcriptional regulator